MEDKTSGSDDGVVGDVEKMNPRLFLDVMTILCPCHHYSATNLHRSPRAASVAAAETARRTGAAVVAVVDSVDGSRIRDDDADVVDRVADDVEADTCNAGLEAAPALPQEAVDSTTEVRLVVGADTVALRASGGVDTAVVGGAVEEDLDCT